MDKIIEFMEIFPPISRFESFLLVLILIPTTIALITGAPWVPTPKNRVRKMLELAKIKKGDTVIDLGCGDGRLVHIADAEYEANATGFEFSPVIYAMAKLVQPFYWLKGSRGKIKFRNFFKQDLSNADVIVCYLLPHGMRKVKKKCEKELKKGSRVISYAFQIEGWKEVHRERRIRKHSYGPIWVYEIGKQ
jgi:SAM-dependent methyltransferase